MNQSIDTMNLLEYYKGMMIGWNIGPLQKQGRPMVIYLVLYDNQLLHLICSDSLVTFIITVERLSK